LLAAGGHEDDVAHDLVGMVQGGLGHPTQDVRGRSRAATRCGASAAAWQWR
jgi:hypothetical protein